MSWNRRSILALAVLASSPRRSEAQAVSADLWKQLSREGRYLPLLRALESDPAAAGEHGLLQQYCSLVGDEARALGAHRTPPPWSQEELAGFRAEPALDAIVRQAERRRIVILNEAHNASQNRAFAGDVARALRPLGFRLFAAEAFNGDAGDRLDGQLDCGWGFYTSDPAFGGTLRTARELGYRFAAYEHQPGAGDPRQRIAEREAGQAAKLAALLKASPNERLLVYCGYAHLLETPANGNGWMAARLKVATGLDPLTIDQSQGVPPFEGPADHPVMQLIQRFSVSQPVSVTTIGGRAAVREPYAGRVDIAVVHPWAPTRDGRPGWLGLTGDRRAVVFEASTPLSEGLLQAVLLSETGMAAPIPADQFPVEAGTSKATFFLQAGEYEVRLETLTGRARLGSVKV